MEHSKTVSPAVNVTRSVFFMTSLIALVLPKSIAVLLPVLAILAASHLQLTGRLSNLSWRMPAPILAFSLFFVLAAISSTWALDPGDALKRSLLGLVSVISAHVILKWFDENNDLARSASSSFMSGMVVGVAFVLFEVLSKQAMANLIVGELLGQKVGFFQLNLNLSVANLFLWPFLILASSQGRSTKTIAVAAAMFAAILVATFASEHETSKLTLAVSMVTVAFAYVWPKISFASLKLGWIVATLLIVPLSLLVHQKLMLENKDWIQPSGAHRIIIWGNLASRVLEAPILGHGARSIYKINDIDKHSGKGLRDIGMNAIPPHSHNVYLQNWFELGAVGALLLSAAGILAMNLMRVCPAEIFPLAAGMVATWITQIFPSFEIWQIWYLNLLTLGIVLTVGSVMIFRCSRDGEVRSLGE